MKIATYNLNSINARLQNLIDWLKNADCDVVFLQEIKTEFNNFPFFEIQSLGYDVKIVGQKSYNGVAILSKHKLQNIIEAIPNFDDENARYLQAEIICNQKQYLIASIYFPNGNPVHDIIKFGYKLNFMKAFYSHAQNLLTQYENIIFGGDFNVIMTPNDIYDEKVVENNALYQPEVIRLLKAVEYLGFYDAYRAKNPNQEGYTYWDYAGAAFVQNLGMRIDYFYISPKLVDKLEQCFVDKSLRFVAGPSDHTALVVRFS